MACFGLRFLVKILLDIFRRRKTRFPTIIIILGAVSISCFFYSVYFLKSRFDLEQIQIDYVRWIAKKQAIPYPMVDIKQIATGQNHLPQVEQKTNKQQEQLANQFNLSTKTLDSKKTAILSYHLQMVARLDKILASNNQTKMNAIDIGIDRRRLSGWNTNLKLSEFRPIINIELGAGFCDSESLGADLLSLIFIITKPSDFQLRELIRQTWAAKFIEDYRFKIYFPLGHSSVYGHQQEIQNEQKIHQDLIQWNFVEQYSMLTIKSLAMIRWSAVYCPLVPFIYKVDGDGLVNYENFKQFLITQIHQTKHPSSSPLLRIHGSIFHWAQPFRTDPSKFKLSVDDYPYFFYPNYADSTYLISGNQKSLMIYATAIQETMPAIPWEDVYITGLIPARIRSKGITIEHATLPGFVDRMDAKSIDRFQFHRNIIFTHKMNVYNLLEVWHQINSSRQTPLKPGCFNWFFDLLSYIL